MVVAEEYCIEEPSRQDRATNIYIHQLLACARGGKVSCEVDWKSPRLVYLNWSVQTLGSEWVTRNMVDVIVSTKISHIANMAPQSSSVAPPVFCEKTATATTICKMCSKCGPVSTTTTNKPTVPTNTTTGTSPRLPVPLPIRGKRSWLELFFLFTEIMMMRKLVV